MSRNIEYFVVNINPPPRTGHDIFMLSPTAI